MFLIKGYMKKILLLTLLVSMQVFANADCCICEVGQKDASGINANLIERTLFKKGCQIVLNKKNNCAVKVIQSTDKKSLRVPAQCVGQNIDLSYVGHWDSSAVQQHNAMFEYYDNVLLPISKELNVDIKYDNTACLSASDHSLKMIVENRLESAAFIKLLEASGSATDHFESKKNIIIKGSQSVSVGVWGEVIKTYDNIWAEINTQTLEIKYPFCSAYVGNTCDTDLHKHTKSDIFCVNDLKNDQEKLYKIKCRQSKNNSNELFSTARKNSIGAWEKETP